MENHLGAIPVIKTAGANGGGIRPDVPFAMVAAGDVAAAGAELLLAPTFTGDATREVYGPRDYSLREATAILGAAIGRPDLAYLQFPLADVRSGLLSAGFSPDVAVALVELQAGFNDGRVMSTVKRTAANTTRTTLEEFAREVFAPAYGHVEVPSRESA